jgi:hypothetical protein
MFALFAQGNFEQIPGTNRKTNLQNIKPTMQQSSA